MESFKEPFYLFVFSFCYHVIIFKIKMIAMDHDIAVKYRELNGISFKL